MHDNKQKSNTNILLHNNNIINIHINIYKYLVQIFI